MNKENNIRKEVFAILERIDPEVKVIFLCGYSKSDTAENMIIDGEVGFLQKPFRLHEASQIISKTLGNSVS